MSSNIWTQCGGISSLRPLLLKPWRAVEGQHVVSTRKIVDSFQEQQLLERLVEESERATLAQEPAGLHPLLSAPFREPPLRHGSRFGVRTERGVWYGSESERTAFAEVSYYRLLFLEGTTADLPPIVLELMTFRVPVHTERGIDLTAPPFEPWLDVLVAKTEYAVTQALGSAMRRDGVEAFRYVSARDVEGGTNVGLFTQQAFAARRPRSFLSWLCVATRTGVELLLKHPFHHRSYSFPREEFEVDGALPAPAV